jgi:hypothetical protein
MGKALYRFIMMHSEAPKLNWDTLRNAVAPLRQGNFRCDVRTQLNHLIEKGVIHHYHEDENNISWTKE